MKNILFDECIISLKAKVLSLSESKKMENIFTHLFPTTGWGKIDWDKIDRKIEIGYNPLDIIPALQKLLGTSFDRCVYIEWSDGELPIIKSTLDAIIQNFDDVTCVSFEKFIFNPTMAYIIEVLPGNKITLGVIPQTDA